MVQSFRVSERRHYGPGSPWKRHNDMAGALIAAVPVAIAYNLFLDRLIAGITGGAVK